LGELAEAIVESAQHRHHDLFVPSEQAPRRDEEEPDAYDRERDRDGVDGDRQCLRHSSPPLPQAY
jgi:hypothetical protein